MLGNLFIFMSFQMLIPTLPPYIKSLGASGLEIGLVTALFSIGAVLSRPFIGYMLEYKARKPLVLIGAAALLAITIFYPISNVILIFLMFRFIHGLAWGFSTTVNGTAAVDVIPNSRLGEGMGYFGLSVTLGMIIAPSLGIFLFGVTTFNNLIYISCALGIIAIILLSAVRYYTPESVRLAKKEDLKFSYLGSLVEKTSWYPAFIVIFGEERGIDQIFIFYLFNAVMASISRPIAGKWFDERGPKGLIVVCSSLTFAGMWALSFSHTNVGIAIAGILFGIGFGSLLPTLQSWTLSKTPDNRRGVANGMFFSAIDFGIGLSGIVFGLLAQFLETAVLFQISSIFLIVPMILTLLEGKSRRVQKKQTAASTY
jgi:MFS family permease